MNDDEKQLREIESILPKERVLSGLVAIAFLVVLAFLFEDVSSKAVQISISISLIIVGLFLSLLRKTKEKGIRNG